MVRRKKPSWLIFIGICVLQSIFILDHASADHGEFKKIHYQIVNGRSFCDTPDINVDLDSLLESEEDDARMLQRKARDEHTNILKDGKDNTKFHKKHSTFLNGVENSERNKFEEWFTELLLNDNKPVLKGNNKTSKENFEVMTDISINSTGRTPSVFNSIIHPQRFDKDKPFNIFPYPAYKTSLYRFPSGNITKVFHFLNSQKKSPLNDIHYDDRGSVIVEDLYNPEFLPVNDNDDLNVERLLDFEMTNVFENMLNIFRKHPLKVMKSLDRENVRTMTSDKNTKNLNHHDISTAEHPLDKQYTYHYNDEISVTTLQPTKYKWRNLNIHNVDIMNPNINKHFNEYGGSTKEYFRGKRQADKILVNKPQNETNLTVVSGENITERNAESSTNQLLSQKNTVLNVAINYNNNSSRVSPNSLPHLNTDVKTTTATELKNKTLKITHQSTAANEKNINKQNINYGSAGKVENVSSLIAKTNKTEVTIDIPNSKTGYENITSTSGNIKSSPENNTIQTDNNNSSLHITHSKINNGTSVLLPPNESSAAGHGNSSYSVDLLRAQNNETGITAVTGLNITNNKKEENNTVLLPLKESSVAGDVNTSFSTVRSVENDQSSYSVNFVGKEEKNDDTEDKKGLMNVALQGSDNTNSPEPTAAFALYIGVFLFVVIVAIGALMMWVFKIKPDWGGRANDRGRNEPQATQPKSSVC